MSPASLMQDWSVQIDKFEEYSAVSDDTFLNLGDSLAPEDRIGRDRLALVPVRESLIESGFYAYGMLDDQNRWSIAVDDELGRVDVRVGDDGLDVVLWLSSPGLYADEENEWRRKSRARLARITMSRITKGFLKPHQSAVWDEIEEGIAVSEQYQLPFTRAPDVGPFVRENLPKLETVLETIERQLD